MRDSDRRDLEATVRRVASGSTVHLARADFIALLVSVRQHARPGSTLRDLGDSTAHDIRDRGDVHRHLQRTIDAVVGVVTSGTSDTIEARLVHPVEDVLSDLNAVLSGEEININLDPMDSRVRKTMAWGVAQALDGTSFDLKQGRATMSSGTPNSPATLPHIRLYLDGTVTLQEFLAFEWLLTLEEARGDWSSVL